MKRIVAILAAFSTAFCHAFGQGLDLNRDGILDYKLVHYFDGVGNRSEGLLLVDLVTYGSNEILIEKDFFAREGAALLPRGTAVNSLAPQPASWAHPINGPWIGLPDGGPSVSLIHATVPDPLCCGVWDFDIFHPPDREAPWNARYIPSGYVGLRFSAADGLHYGWLSLAVDPALVQNPSGWHPWIIGFDYNPNVGEAIVIPIPEPSIGLLLLLGGTLLFRYTRRTRSELSNQPIVESVV